jgi:glycosyltransferase involved in cell wall biosynthesis
MDVAVSVVVPVYNPGPSFDRCLHSLLGQTLEPARYEIVLVDDGSTDGSAERVDRVAVEHPRTVRVEHIPNSGWPSRPRNIGIELARGRYVQFVDNDDTLAADALRRLVEVADESDADVVVGKLSSDFRGLKHRVFRETVTRQTLETFPFEETLTPHKMFRRAFLDEHGIRFDEAVRNLEDQIFCMQAYVHGRSLALVGDLASYFYLRRRGGGRNAGDRHVTPEDYYRDLETVLDVVDAHVPDRALRARIQRRFYRGELLGRVREQALLDYPPSYREEICAEVRRVAAVRILPEVHPMLGALVRVQSALVRSGDTARQVDYSRRLVALRLVADAVGVRWESGGLQVEVDGGYVVDDRPLRLEPDGGGWLLPDWLAPGASAADRRVDPADVAGADVDVTLASRIDTSVWSTTDGVALVVGPDGTVRVTGSVRLDPGSVMGGRPLSPGLWDVRLRVEFAGLVRSARLAPADGVSAEPAGWLGTGEAVVAHWTHPRRYLALDVGEWSHPLHGLVAAAPSRLTAEVRGRRLRLRTTAIAGDPHWSRQVWVVLVGDSHAPLTRCPAVAVADPSGITITADLPARLESDVEVWLGFGPPGAAPPVPVGIRLVGSGRQIQVSVAPAPDIGPGMDPDVGKDALVGSGLRGERPDEPDR